MPTRPVPSYIQRPDYADHPLGKSCLARLYGLQFVGLIGMARNALPGQFSALDIECKHSFFFKSHIRTFKVKIFFLVKNISSSENSVYVANKDYIQKNTVFCVK